MPANSKYVQKIMPVLTLVRWAAEHAGLRIFLVDSSETPFECIRQIRHWWPDTFRIWRLNTLIGRPVRSGWACVSTSTRWSRISHLATTEADGELQHHMASYSVSCCKHVAFCQTDTRNHRRLEYGISNFIHTTTDRDRDFGDSAERAIE